MIQLAQLHKTFGDRVLFDHVTWQIGDRERVGLCGPNGAGKTTLLRMLAGIDEPDSGQVVTPSGLTVGYLPQDGLNHRGRTLLDEASMAFAELLGQKAEMHALEARLGDDSVPEGEHESMLVRYAELQERFRRDDGYSIDLRIATVLRGLGFSQDDLAKPTETFSGGWQMRIALAKLLLGRPGLLLLDEPTNHLDLDARNWLEEYLSTYPHAVILVSHDRYFLDAVVTRITDLNLRTLTDYVGNYSKYVEQRDAMLERLRQAKRDQDEEVARVKMFIDRFRYQATKAAQVQSRIKMLDKVVPIEVPPERKRVRFTFPTAPKSGRTVLELKGVRKAYGATRVFGGIDLLIERGDRVALIGPNGAGKSTLMRILSGVEAPDAGTRDGGPPGRHAVLRAGRGDAARADADGLRDARGRLAGPDGAGDPHDPRRLPVRRRRHLQEGRASSRAASARGWRWRACCCGRPTRCCWTSRPTISTWTRRTSCSTRSRTSAARLILVSHDRYFIDRLATKVIDVGGGAASVYPGGYEEYRWSLAKREEEAAAKAAAKAGAGQGGAQATRQGRARRREGRSRRRPTSGGPPRRRRPSRRRPGRATGARIGSARKPRSGGASARAKPSKAGSRRSRPPSPSGKRR